MRTRLPIFRVAGLAAAVAVGVLVAQLPQAAAQDAATAVNQGPGEAERILSELRSRRSTGLDAEALSDDAVPDTAEPKADGTLAETPAPDGKLAEQPAAEAPVDGDMAADGKIAEQAVRDVRDQPDADTGAEAVVAGARMPPRTAIAPTTDGPANSDDVPDAPLARPRLRAAAEDTETDPYAPFGIKRGGFLIMPSLTVGTLYSDNVLQSGNNRRSDIALALRPGVNLQSQWSTHSLALDLRGATNTYAQITSQFTDEVHAALTGRFDISSRSNIEGEAGYDLSPLMRSDPAVAGGAIVPGTSRSERLGLAYNQTVGRLQLRLHGLATATAQGDSGETFADRDLDGKASYEFSPKLTGFATLNGTSRRFSSGPGVDVNGGEARIGLQTDPAAKLSAVASVGLGRIAANDEHSGSATAVVAEITATWLPSALTNVTLAASHDLAATDAANAVAVSSSRASAEVKHKLRRWFSLLAGVSVESREFSGISLTDEKHVEHVGFEYDFNRQWALLGDYQRTDLSASDAARNFSEDQVTLGMRWQR